MTSPFNKFEERPLPRGRHWREAFDSRYLRHYWLANRPRIVTITKVEELLSSNKNESKKQLLLTLAEAEKKWAINVTNSGIIEMISGKTDPNDWVGLRVELYPTKTRDPKGAMVDCIRVKPELPAQGATTEKPKWRQEVSQYLHELKTATTTEQVEKISVRVVNDEELTAEETPVLLNAAKKRHAQILGVAQ